MNKALTAINIKYSPITDQPALAPAWPADLALE